jgi:hypothetical protein
LEEEPQNMGKIKKQEVKSHKTMEQIMEEASDHKVSFAKVSWGNGRGPYILAFPDSCVRNYCEMNSHEFKTIGIKEIKTDKLPIWEAGVKLPEEINKLPKLDIKKFIENSAKEKLRKKELKGAKISAAAKKRKAKA